jgi:hypothetical protein
VINCKTCGEDKPEDQMVVRRGKAVRLCRVCLGNSIRKKPKGSAETGGGGTTTRKKRKSPVRRKASIEAQPAGETNGQLEMLPGFGFKAYFTDDDRLCVDQVSGEKTDNLTFSKTEFKVLAAQFAEWAGFTIAKSV